MAKCEISCIDEFNIEAGGIRAGSKARSGAWACGLLQPSPFCALLAAMEKCLLDQGSECPAVRESELAIRNL